METVSELKAKAAELRSIASKLDAAADALLLLGVSSNGQNTTAPNAFQQLQQSVRDLKNMSGVDAIERVLEDSSTPLNKEAISQFLSARGKAIGGTTLQSYLSREKKRFASLGRGQWTTVRKKNLAEM